MNRASLGKRKRRPRVAKRLKRKSLYDIGFDRGYDLGLQVGRRQGGSAPPGPAHPDDAGKADYDRGFDDGHDHGYRKGYDEGYDSAAGSYYDKGMYDGGEGIIDRLLGTGTIIPDATIEQVIEAGLGQLSDRHIRLLTAAEVAGRMLDALAAGRPLSVVRLGDGELLTLSQQSVLSVEEVRRRGHFLSYAGVEVPDFEARDMLAASIRKADIVGVPYKREKNFQPLLAPCLKAAGIDYRGLALTASIINYSLYEEGWLARLLSGRRTFVIGNRAAELAGVLAEGGVTIAGIAGPVNGIHDAERILGSVSNADFEIALVSAGIAAVPIAQRIASEFGRVALDFGHLADHLANGTATYPHGSIASEGGKGST